MKRNHLKFEFDCPIQKAYKDDSGKMHVIAVASDDGIDLAEERISLVAQKQMAKQCTENALALLDNHRTTFGFGKSVEGTVVRSKETNHNELLIDFELDAKYPQAHDLFAAVSADANNKQLSIGGFVDREQDTLETTKDGHIVRVINAIELEHIAMTRTNMACNPRTRTLAAVIKSLYDTADNVVPEKPVSAVAPVKKAAVEFKSFPTVPLEDEITGWTFTIDESNQVLWRGAGVSDGESFARAADDLQSQGWGLFKSAHAWWNNTLGDLPPTKLAYKLPHHKLIKGQLVTFFQGVAHAMSRALPGGFNSGLIPHTERDAVVVHLAHHYAEFDVELPEKAKRFLSREISENSKAAALAQWLLGVNYSEHQTWLELVGRKDIADQIEKIRSLENDEYEDRVQKGIVAFKSWPLADKEASPSEWSFTRDDKTAILYKGAGVQSSRDWMNVSEKARMRGWGLFRQCHAYIDDAYEGFPYPQNKNAYLLAHHKLEKDSLKTFFSGVAKSMASLMPGGWARRRIRSPHARRKVWRHLSGHLREFGVEPPSVKDLDSMMLEDFVEWFKEPKLTDSADTEFVLWEVRKVFDSLTNENTKVVLSADPTITNDVFDVDSLVVKRVIVDESTIVPETEPQVSRLVVRSGDEQVGLPGILLPEPLVVWARTAEGQPAQGVRVEFTVSGNAILSTDGMETDSAGRAWVLVTLGEDVGDVVVLAESDGFGPPVSFKLMAKNEEDTNTDASAVNDDENVQASADVEIDNKAAAEDTPVTEKSPVPFKKYPLAKRDASWSFSGSDGNALLGDDGDNWAEFKTVHAWFDDAEGQTPQKKDAYKLPHHKLVDDKVKTFFRGVVAAGVALVGGRRDVKIPEKDRSGVARHIAAHYREFDEEPPDRLQALTQRGIEDTATAKAEDVEEALTDALAEFLLAADVDAYLKWLSDNGHKDIVKEIVVTQEEARHAELGLDDEVVAEIVAEETPDAKEDSAVTIEVEPEAPASDPLTDAIAALATLFGKMQTEDADDIKALLVENAAKGVNPQLLALAAILERTKPLTRDKFTEKDLALARRLHEAFFTLLQRIGAADEPINVDEEIIKSLQSPLSLVLKEALETQSNALTSLLAEKLKTVETKAVEAVTERLDKLQEVFKTRLGELESSLHGVGERVEVVESVSGASQQLMEPVTKGVKKPSKSNPYKGWFNNVISGMNGFRRDA